MCRIALIVCFGIALQACGDAFESITIGDWREVGSPQPPEVDPESSLKITASKVSDGNGRPIRAGDLVKVRITAKNGYFVAPHPVAAETAQSQELWLWTGRGPSISSYADFMNWGDLGSAQIRSALIGVPVNGRLLVRPTQGRVSIPLKGLTVQHYSGPNPNEDHWPDIHFENKTAVEIEILDACTGRMFRKSATMTQFGYILNMFDSSWETSRAGSLNWSALEGDCPPPVGKIRFEIGPLYWRTPSSPPRLYGWQYSYKELSEEPLGIRVLGLSLVSWLIISLAIVGWLAFRARRKRP